MNDFQKVTCAIGSLPAGATFQAQIVASVVPPARFCPEDATNVAQVESSSPSDPDLRNNSATTVVDIGPCADLDIVQTDSPDLALVGGSLTYLLEVTNHGPEDPASDVKITDNLPSEVEFFDATTEGVPSACSQGSHVVTCTLPTLFPGELVQVRIRVIPRAAAPAGIDNEATVTSTTYDPFTSDNRSIETTTVLPGA